MYENQLSSPVNYSIQLQGTNQYGCSDNANEQITIYPEVEAGFMHDTSGCSVFEVNFHNQSYGAQFFTWNFGDNGTSQDINPSHDFANYTTNDVEYNIEMIASSIYSCSDTAYSSLVVYPSPIASFSVSPLSQTYPSTIVDIDNLSSAGNWNYSWDFGNGTFSDEQNPVSVDYQQWGDYEITLEVYSQHCSDATSLMVEIIPAEPTASFGSSASGCAPFTMKFTNNTQYATSYLWTFGDGFTSTHEEPIHTFYDPGIYNVSLQAIGPGGEDYTQDATIEVFEVPEAYFSVG
ncbi:MAG: pkd domain containing protein, partial [Marinilabiliales bacterium]